MVVVVLFLLLFLGLWGQVARQIGSLLRVEEARARRIRRDSDRLPATLALASALAALESGFPPGSPYTCGFQALDGSVFLLRFERDPLRPDEWTVRVEPTSDTPPEWLDPAQFGPAAP